MKKLHEQARLSIARKRAIYRAGNRSKKFTPKPQSTANAENMLDSSDDELPQCILPIKGRSTKLATAEKSHIAEASSTSAKGPIAEPKVIEPHAPVAVRQSARTFRKPDWFGNNVLGFIIEDSE